MNCCSIVEAPWTLPLWRMSWTKARAIPRMSIPLLVSKRLSSIEITASLTIWRDLVGADDHAVLLAEHADRMPQVVEQGRALRVLDLGEVGQRGQVGGDRDEHPEDERDEAQQQHGEEDRREAQPLQARLRRRGRRRGGYVGKDINAHRQLR